MSEPITIQIRARHYRESVFINERSPIDRAAKEYFGPDSSVYDMVWDMKVNGMKYTHEKFGVHDYDQDMIKAAGCDFDDTVIRTIVLIPKVDQSASKPAESRSVQMKPKYKPGKR